MKKYLALVACLGLCVADVTHAQWRRGGQQIIIQQPQQSISPYAGATPMYPQGTYYNPPQYIYRYQPAVPQYNYVPPNAGATMMYQQPQGGRIIIHRR